MSIFASKITSTVTFPGYKDGDKEQPPVVVTIRKLSGKSLDKAAEARAIASMRNAASMGGDALVALRKDAQRTSATAEPVQVPLDVQAAARYAQYDREQVLLAGVTAWTDPRKLAEGIEDLSEEPAEQLKRAILDLSLPPIDPAVVEAAPKGD